MVSSLCHVDGEVIRLSRYPQTNHRDTIKLQEQHLTASGRFSVHNNFYVNKFELPWSILHPYCLCNKSERGSFWTTEGIYLDHCLLKCFVFRKFGILHQQQQSPNLKHLQRELRSVPQNKLGWMFLICEGLSRIYCTSSPITTEHRQQLPHDPKKQVKKVNGYFQSYFTKYMIVRLIHWVWLVKWISIVIKINCPTRTLANTKPCNEHQHFIIRIPETEREIQTMVFK